MPSSDPLGSLVHPLFSTRTPQEHHERLQLHKLYNLFSSKRNSAVTVGSIQDDLDHALVDMALHGYVLPPHESDVADELRNVGEHRRLPVAMGQGKTKITCELPAVNKPLPKALEVVKGLFKKYS